MKLRIGINGFGRIGRNFLRVIFADKNALQRLDVVAINIGPSDPNMVAHLFKYDSMLGIFDGQVLLQDDELIINGTHIKIYAHKDPIAIPWKELHIDWVVEASGKFTKRNDAVMHLQAGASRVLITAPSRDADITIIPGVNSLDFNPNNHTVVSLGSCTTNAITPMLKVLHEAFGVVSGFMTTIHAYTNSQVLLDVERSDVRRARAAGLNIIPTTTGAMTVLDAVYPALKGKIGGSAIRVPVAKVSLIDLTVWVEAKVHVKEINDVFQRAEQHVLRGILGLSNEPLVSSDYSCNKNSVTIDGMLTDVKGQCVKVFGWYDNEWGYSERLKDFLLSHGDHK